MLNRKLEMGTQLGMKKTITLDQLSIMKMNFTGGLIDYIIWKEDYQN